MTRDSVISFATTAVNFAVSVLVSVIVSRALGPAGRGALAVILVTSALLAQLANVGLGGSIVYHIGQAKYPLREVVAAAVWVTVGLGILGTVAFLPFYCAFRSTLFGRVPSVLLLLVTATTPVVMLSSSLRQILVGRKQMLRYSALTMFTLGVSLVSTIVLVAVARAGLTGAVGAGVLTSGVGLVAAAILVFRTSPARVPPNIRVMGSLLGFGAKSYIGNLMAFLALRVDTYFIKFFSGLEGVGYYSISNALANPLLLLADSVNLVLLPRTSSLSAKESGELTCVVTRNTVLLSFMGGISLLLTGRFLIQFLYGPAFLPAFVPLVVLLPGLLLRAADKTLSAYVLGRGRPLICSAAAGSGLVVGMILYLLLIPPFGIAGAALSSSVSYATSFLLILVAFTRVSGKKASDALLPRRGDLKLYTGAWARFARQVDLGAGR